MIAVMARWSPMKSLKLMALYGVLLAIVAVFVSFLDLLMPFLLAGFLAFALLPLVDRLEGLGFSRGGAVVTVYVAIGTSILFTVWILSHFLGTQVEKFQRELPTYLASIQQMIEGGIKDLKKAETKNALLKLLGISKMLPSSSPQAGQSQQMTAIFGQLAGSAGTVLSSIAGWAVYLALAPFLAFFFLRDGPAIKKSLIKMVPNRYFEMALSIHYEVDRHIRSFFKGQILEGACVGVLAGLGLWWIGLSYAFFVGLVAGVTNLIPYMGPLMGSLVGVAVALIDGHSISLAVKVVAMLMVVQFIDSAILSTLIMGKSVDMHPALVVLALILGGSLMGVFGMLLGVPLLASILVTMKILGKGFEEYRI